MNTIEEWKFIPGYENLYQCSNLGRIKSFKLKNEHILSQSDNGWGYNKVRLYKNKSSKIIKVHQLVAMTFLNHIPNSFNIVVDHIDGNRLNNNLINLRLVTNRENCSLNNRKEFNNFSSKYVGVCWFKRNKNWKSSIRYNKKTYHLGYFNTEIEASDRYQEALIHIKDNTFIKWLYN